MLRPGVTQVWVDEGELPRERTKNRRWQRPYDVLAEATQAAGSSTSVNNATAKRAMDSRGECHGTAEVGLPYDRSGWRVGLLQCSHSLMGARQVRGQGRRRDFRRVIDPLLLWRESIGRKRGRGGGECKDKLQVPRHGRSAEAKKLHKTNVDGLLIKIAESEGL
ncbi:hypothetical protein BHE74_00044039 [Ensete ventricosum]|nr:hypothetical protein BHE74_00044039 [Ensete ventricosum]